MYEIENNVYVTGAPIISVIGLGGAGINMLRYLYQRQIDGIAYSFYDKTHIPLEYFTDVRVERCSLRSLNAFKFENKITSIDGFVESEVKIVILVAGLGGNTGTESVKTIASMCKARGLHVIGYLMTPFRHEGAQKMKLARETIFSLSDRTDLLCVISNNRLRENYGSLTAKQAFEIPESMLLASLEKICQVNRFREYFDVRKEFLSIFKESGIGEIGYFM